MDCWRSNRVCVTQAIHGMNRLNILYMFLICYLSLLFRQDIGRLYYFARTEDYTMCEMLQNLTNQRSYP